MTALVSFTFHTLHQVSAVFDEGVRYAESALAFMWRFME